MVKYQFTQFPPYLNSINILLVLTNTSKKLILSVRSVHISTMYLRGNECPPLWFLSQNFLDYRISRLA